MNCPFILSSVLLIFNVALFGQTAMVQELGEADDLFLNSKFAAALPHYLNYLKKDSSNIKLYYKIGVCYLNSRSQKLKAIPYLEKALAGSPEPATHRSLGDAYHLTNKLDRAIASYEKFLEAMPKPNPKEVHLVDEVSWKIKMCKVGMKLQELDTALASINYRSSLAMDQSAMTFTFQRENGIKQNLPADEMHFEEVYITLKTTPAPASKITVDTTTYRNEATVATSVDGHIILTYMNDNGEANLYISRLAGNQWTSLEKLTRPVNPKGWEPNECISADGYTMYFTSNRAGGFGGKDIYMCKKMYNGEWGKAMNLGAVINTPLDEEAPFMYSDGITLLFSSNKLKQRCCFDVFKSTLSNVGVWSEPAKVGYPVKTSADEVFYATTVYQEYSPEAIRAGDYNKKDLFRVTFLDEKKIPFTVLKGKVLDINGKVPRAVKITVTDNETGEVLGIYSSHRKSGDYVIPLPSGRNNNVTYESNGYLFQSENMDVSKNGNYYEEHKLVLLPPLTNSAKVVLSNIFFDFDKSSLRSVSNIELNSLFQFLFMNPEMVVELSYYPDPKENNKYNDKLAIDRAQAVVNYMIAKGINKERLLVTEAVKSKAVIKYDLKNKVIQDQPGERLELKIVRQ